MAKILFFLLVAVFYSDFARAYEHMCYYTSWGGTQPDPNLCTTVIYSFADMSGGVLSGLWGNPLSHLKQANPKIKLLIAVGGWNFGVTRMTEMLATHESRQRFADHAATYVRSLGFDGLDLDFEFPATNYPQYGRYSPPEDKQRFTLLCQQLRAAFEKEALATSKERLLLTVAFGCRKEDIDLGYEIGKLAEHIDFFNLMTYDLRGAFDSIASHHTALYAGKYETGAQSVYNDDWVVRHFIESGAPPSKIILGLASYGKSFRWTSQPYELGNNAVFADWHGYADICSKLRSGWQREWIEEQQVPILKSGNMVIGYDDVPSIKIKAEYVISMGLGGAMWWSLDHDDAGGHCGEGRFPLINAAKKVLDSGEVSTTTTTKSSNVSSTSNTTSSGSITTAASTTTTTTIRTTTTTTPGTTNPNAIAEEDAMRYSCSSGKEFVKHPTDCTKLYRCTTGEEMKCPGGTVFDYDLQICNWAYNVECKVLASPITTTTPETTTTTTTTPTTTTTTTTTTISSTTPTTPLPPTTPSDDGLSPIQKLCLVDGVYASPEFCHQYVLCSGGEIVVQSCPKLAIYQLYFDEGRKLCDFESKTTLKPGCIKV